MRGGTLHINLQGLGKARVTAHVGGLPVPSSPSWLPASLGSWPQSSISSPRPFLPCLSCLVFCGDVGHWI